MGLLLKAHFVLYQMRINISQLMIIAINIIFILLNIHNILSSIR